MRGLLERDARDQARLLQLRETYHDMRQPVAGVLALAAAALAEPQLPMAAHARLKQIVEQAEWLAEIIGHGLEDDRNTAPSYRTDVALAAKEAAAAQWLTWTGEISLVDPVESVCVAVHPVVLRRMAANLLDNAARAAGPAGTMRITISSRTGWVQMVVEDDGPGFGQIQKGLGLGLSAATRCVVKHGGRVECTRSPLGGACVALWLPAAAGPAERRVAAAGRSRSRWRNWGAVRPHWPRSPATRTGDQGHQQRQGSDLPAASPPGLRPRADPER